MDSNKKILLEQSDWVLISCSKKSNWSHCKQKEEGGNCFYSPSSCKSKPPTPKPPTPKQKDEPKPESESIVYCKWKPSQGMIFKCNSGCGEMESGDSFRDYVNRIFPEIAEKNKLVKIMW